MPPNSVAVVCAASTAPAVRRRDSDVSSWSETRSLKSIDASVYGQPSTRSSSLTPQGTPPKGSVTLALRAASRARSKSVKLKALSGDASMAAMQASRASSGDSSLARKASTRPQASSSHGVLIGAESTRAPVTAPRRSVACPA